MSGGRRVQRVRQPHIEWLTDRLSKRDWQVVSQFRAVRMLTGAQLERLCFADLAPRSRSVMRWRVLKRLALWRVLLPLPRRVGGPTHGSAVTAYVLDTAGQALVRNLDHVHGDATRRRPGLPGERFIRHVLATSELYVRLVEATRAENFQLVTFAAEPIAWMPDGLGGWLKPDAFLVLAAGDITDDWFAEIDLATEHVPTLRRKIETYLDFFARGQLGPNGVMPRVIISVPDDGRRAALQAMLDRLPEPACALVRVATDAETVPYLVRALKE